MTTIKPKLTFYGANHTVTGSKTLVSAGPDLDDRLLIDCGMFQGKKELRLRNWSAPPFDPITIGSIALTHGHLDHCGYLPVLVRAGYASPIYCTNATAEITRIILMDAAHLQEEEAEFANKYGYSKHKPAKPLFNTENAKDTLQLLSNQNFHEDIDVGKHIKIRFYHAGHILGSSLIKVTVSKENTRRSIVFSGDLGRFGIPILPNPEVPDEADILVLESTYGDRIHADNDIGSELADVINSSIQRQGVLLIPAFAIGRTQRLLYLLRELQANNEIPSIPIYMDSPMAIHAVESYSRQISSMDDETKFLEKSGDHPLKPLNLNICKSPSESKALNKIHKNAIIISASGMVTGGRILHHMKLRLPNKNDTVLFIGYQAVGTRGRTIVEKKPSVKIHGRHIPIHCAIRQIDGLSAHADHDEILTWLKMFQSPPRQILLNHGETNALTALKSKIESHFDIPVHIPDYLEEFEMD